MGRVNRLMERRVLRRAADEALLTPAFVRSIDIPPGTASRVDTASHVDAADPGGSEPDTDAREPLDAITEPIAVTAVHDRLRNAADTVGLDDVPAAEHATDLPAAAVGTWEPALIEPRRVRVGPPWYRTKAAAAVAVAAIVASGVLLVSRGSVQTTTVAPEVATTAVPHLSSGRPAPSSAPPAASNAPSAPPPPPVPPSTIPASPSPVVRNDDSWTPSPPSPTKKPEIGVTRAPFSATPPPPPAPAKNSATPGDGRPPHWGPW